MHADHAGLIPEHRVKRKPRIQQSLVPQPKGEKIEVEAFKTLSCPKLFYLLQKQIYFQWKQNSVMKSWDLSFTDVNYTKKDGRLGGRGIGQTLGHW